MGADAETRTFGVNNYRGEKGRGVWGRENPI